MKNPTDYVDEIVFRGIGLRVLIKKDLEDNIHIFWESHIKIYCGDECIAEGIAQSFYHNDDKIFGETFDSPPLNEEPYLDTLDFCDMMGRAPTRVAILFGGKEYNFAIKMAAKDDDLKPKNMEAGISPFF